MLAPVPAALPASILIPPRPPPLGVPPRPPREPLGVKLDPPPINNCKNVNVYFICNLVNYKKMHIYYKGYIDF